MKLRIAMATTLKEKLERLPPSRRKKIEERAAELIAEEMTRQEPKQALAPHLAADGRTPSN